MELNDSLCNPYSENKYRRVIPNTEVYKAQGEIGPKTQKKLREIIEKAEAFLLDLNLSKNSTLPEIYAKTASSADKELQLDIAKVLQAVATLFEMPEVEFMNNILEISSDIDITKMPSPVRKKKQDENLIDESNHLIKQINNIISCFKYLTPFIEIEIERIKSPYELEFSIFKIPLDTYHTFYRKHFTMLDKISNSGKPLLEKLANRIIENQNKHIMPEESLDVLSYANTLESKDSKTTILNFKKQTNSITIIYKKISGLKEELDISYSRFKLKCNYFMHLCAFQKRPNIGYYSTIFKPHYPNWYNYLEQETLCFSSDDLLIDMQYRQHLILKTFPQPSSKNQSGIVTHSFIDEDFEDIFPSSSNSPHLKKPNEEQLDSVDLTDTSFSSSSEESSLTDQKKKLKPTIIESLSEDDYSCLGVSFSSKDSSS